MAVSVLSGVARCLIQADKADKQGTYHLYIYHLNLAAMDFKADNRPT